MSVLDISQNALDATRKRLGGKADLVEWLVADITEFEPAHRFHVWHDRAVFHFLTKADDRAKYVASLHNALPVGGHAIIAAFAIGGPEKCSGLDIVQYDLEKLTKALGPGFKLVEQASENHMTPAGGEQKFSYFHMQRTQ